ncbi:MAG: NYN domain-containing protein [Microcystaceae cyanobacterium]
MTKNSHSCVALCIDSQNVPLNEESFLHLIQFTNSKGENVRVKYYYNSHQKNEQLKKENLACLNVGYSINFVDIPYCFKDSADNQLKSDVLDLIYSYNPPKTLILVSGDGDFLSLIKAVKQLDIKIIIIARKGNIKKKLTEIADYYFIEDLGNQKNSSSTQHLITYQKAVQSLIACLKLYLKENQKLPSLGYMGKLMREYCPNYQGASSIIRPDQNGQTFAKWLKFVEMAAKDGHIKLKKQNEEFVLSF